MELLARETKARRGPVSTSIAGTTVKAGCWVLHGDVLLLHAAPGIRLLYRRGEGVTVDARDDADPRDISLWLNGTIYAAAAALNGLMPLHASAVAHGGRVYAFTGPPGAGKSTLAAALGQAGFSLFCDDTLILDISDKQAIICLPGHKRLKLWPDGLSLAGARACELVASDYPKYFAEPPGGSIRQSLPLAELIFLEDGNEPYLLGVEFGERIARLQDDHYTAQLFERASNLSRAERFGQLGGLAAQIPMKRFVRPFSRMRFAEGRDYLAGHIRTGSAT
jgi:hypothetical protein